MANMPEDMLIDYSRYLIQQDQRSSEEALDLFAKELPYLWLDTYVRMLPLRKTGVCQIKWGNFTYVYDDYATLEAQGIVPVDDCSESRIVGVFGRSLPSGRPRENSRLRGWVGATEKYFGKLWDKGHYIAHSIGGAVDHAEQNVFIQRRDLNRGWSREGKILRRMENHCLHNPGTFLFVRPIYTDASSKPTVIEYGIIMESPQTWIECFANFY